MRLAPNSKDVYAVKKFFVYKNWWAFFWFLFLLYYIPYLTVLVTYCVINHGIRAGTAAESSFLLFGLIPLGVFGFILLLAALSKLLVIWWKDKTIG